MAFHVACPLTCRRICDCDLGFPAGLRCGTAREEFLQQIARVEDFIRNPWTVRPPAAARAGGGTVRVLVPRVAALPPLAQTVVAANAEDAGERDEVVFSSVQARRAALQRQALAASMATEDYVRRLEAGGAVEVPGEAPGDLAREDQVSINAKVICRICFSGENEGSERARRMLSCKHCKKKYHKSCLKLWAENRDLFHWNSWVCPSCRICEQCSRTGDPTKLMFCKRCDAAYHCYCQHPPHKNVTHGPYLCLKHTRCHSCGSTVPGNGPSTRWFLGYTCCDACGRLFVKGNYCPVCLKVYRDSESTPMVCCDVCQQWVHCVCDGISDEKYQQFQADGNLYYKCAACRADCHQVKDVEDAVRELWKRRDKADSDLIIRLKVAAGLPSHEEIPSVSPFSDEEDSGPILLKNDHGRTLKFAVKGLMNKSTSTKENVKNVTMNLSSPKKHTKKGYRVSSYQKFDDQHEAEAIESDLKNQGTGDVKLYSTDGPQTSLLIKKREAEEGIHNCHVGNSNHIVTKESMTNNMKKVSKVKIKGGKSHSPGMHTKDDDGINTNKGDGTRGTKLVIHLGAKIRNSASSPKSDASSCHREQDSAVCTAKTYESGNISIDVAPEVEERAEKMHTNDEPLPKRDRPLRVKVEAKPLQRSTDDPKPLLKLKFKNPYFEQQSLWAPSGMEEKNSIKGQRSKRKRPTSLEKVGSWNGESPGQLPNVNSIDETIDANWILQKLGKDAIGKRVEVHEPSNNSWCEGAVQDVLDGTTSLVVRLDDGRSRTLELRQQRVRFISKKQKRARAWHRIQKL